MGLFRIPGLIGCAAVLGWIGAIGYGGLSDGALAAQDQSKPTSQGGGRGDSAGVPVLPRGKKLVLKDGSFQVIRSYERNGDRVRYYSVERGEWDEIPAAMVDWDATAKAEALEKADEEAFAKKVHTQEQAQNVIVVTDVDASLQVAPGVFLPQGEGMYVLAGKSVTQLEQVGSAVKTDKKQFLKQVLSPIPIVPSKINIEIPGARAKVRVATAQAEFYLREAPPDPDRTSPIIRSSRPGESGPEVELVKATVKGNNRRLESIQSLFGQQMDPERKTISVERWEVAPSVYRFTLSQPLPPGEYALAEILPDGMNLFVWDFGVEGTAGAKAAEEKGKN
jgi:hypothetical protein